VTQGRGFCAGVVHGAFSLRLRIGRWKGTGSRGGPLLGSRGPARLAHCLRVKPREARPLPAGRRRPARQAAAGPAPG
jgi:hypothetical protein